MKDLTKYITSAFHSNEKYFRRTYPQLYEEVCNYTALDISFKAKLWHYNNKVIDTVTCKNNDCLNDVKFKRSWTEGYSTYCCQKCSIIDVEEKKQKLNYSRKSKLTDKDKEELNLKREIYKQKLEDNKKKKELFFNIDNRVDYIKLLETGNGVYLRENIVKKKLPLIYLSILDYTKELDINFYERAYMFINLMKNKPKCKCCDKELDIIKSIGYREFCSIKCSSIYTNKQARDTFYKTNGVKHHSELKSNIKKRRDRKIDKIINNIGDGEFISMDNDIVKIKCDVCDKIHETHYDILKQRIYLDLNWRNCVSGFMNGVSNGEKELYEFIKLNYDGIILENDRKVINKEIDVYLPELNLGFEFNGLYWHSEINKEPDYHYNKMVDCLNNNIQLIQIYEDEWVYKQEIVKSRILNLLGKSNRIYARKCIVKEVSFKEVKIFLNDNHLQGSVNSSINLGLYYKDKLVSLMTFGKPRRGLMYKSDNNIYELYRFCNLLNTTVVGGASKLFSYFKEKYFDVNEIYSFSALEWSGNLYKQIGFKLRSTVKKSYWFIIGKKRVSRHNYSKNKLVNMGYNKHKTADEILKELKIYKIYGAGNNTYVWLR